MLRALLSWLGYMPMPAPVTTMTVGEALLANDPGDEIVTGHEWAGLRFVATTNYMDVLPHAGQPEIFRIRTNGTRHEGWRWLALYAFQGDLYVFVPGYAERAGVIETSPDGTTAHHGRAFGRVGR